MTGLSVLEGEGIFHAQLDMLAKGVHTNGEGCQHLGGRQQGVHAHARQHNDCAGLIKALRREHVKGRQNENYQNAGYLPEKLRNTPVQLAHAHDLGEEVIQHALIKAVGKAGDYNRQKEKPELGILPENAFYLKQRMLFLHIGKSPLFCKKILILS